MQLYIGLNNNYNVWANYFSDDPFSRYEIEVKDLILHCNFYLKVKSTTQKKSLSL